VEIQSRPTASPLRLALYESSFISGAHHSLEERLMKRLQLGMAACGVLLSVSACGAGETPSASDSAVVTHVDVSRIQEFSSFADLVKASPLVARVRATSDQREVSASQDGADEAVSTLTTMDVLEVFAGNAPEKIVVRQSGSPTYVISDVVPTLKPDSEYILFLRPFTFDADGPGTGEWIITDEVAGFGSSDGKFVRLSEAADIPAEIDPRDPLSGLT
jgi:hypothetical protein